MLIKYLNKTNFKIIKTNLDFIKNSNNILKRNFSTASKKASLSWYRRMKLKIKKYGLFGLYFYVSSYIINFAMFYIIVKCKIIDSEKLFKNVDKIGLGEYIKVKEIQDYMGPKYTDLVVAIAANEMFEVIRIPCVVMVLPYVVKKFRK